MAVSLWGEFLDRMADWSFAGGPAVLRGVAAAAIIYIVALVITRTGKKRYLGRNTVFDLLLAFILGSVLSRAINGGATLAVTAVAGFTMVAMHFLFGELAVRTKRFGKWVKGEGEAVVKDGRVLEDALHGHHLTHNDLEEAARQHGISSMDEVQSAFFERNGRLSLIKKPKTHVVEVDVKEGVQTVRVEIQA